MSAPTFDSASSWPVSAAAVPELAPSPARHPARVPAPGGLPRRGPVCLPPSVQRHVVEFINTHLESRVRVAEVAERFGFSVSYFYRLFRRSFGETPRTYVMRRRLTLAQELLTQTDLALVDIALKAGFTDQSHFSRSFRRLLGTTPGSFRRRGR
jgi:AraC-like DNA-binding protein